MTSSLKKLINAIDRNNLNIVYQIDNRSLSEMHYEYEHAGLERSNPKQSEQHSIKGMDIRSALDRSGFGSNRNLQGNQELKNQSGVYEQYGQNSKQQGQNFYALKSAEVRANQPNQHPGTIKSDMAAHLGRQNNGFGRQKVQESAEHQRFRDQEYPFTRKIQQSEFKNSEHRPTPQGSELKGSSFGQTYGINPDMERSEVKRYDQQSLKNYGQSGFRTEGGMKGSAFENSYGSDNKGVMQGSSFGRIKEPSYEIDNSKGSFKGDSYSFKPRGVEEDLKPFEYANGESSFRLSQSSRMQLNSSLNKNSGKGMDRLQNKSSVEEILSSFSNQHGYYQTIDLINFLTHYSIGEEAEDRFLQQQIFRNMRASFTERYIPQQLERLVTQARYMTPENNYLDEQERKTLYSIYLEYLKDNGREFQLSNEQKMQEFERVLSSLR